MVLPTLFMFISTPCHQIELQTMKDSALLFPQGVQQGNLNLLETLKTSLLEIAWNSQYSLNLTRFHVFLTIWQVSLSLWVISSDTLWKWTWQRKIPRSLYMFHLQKSVFPCLFPIDMFVKTEGFYLHLWSFLEKECRKAWIVSSYIYTSMGLKLLNVHKCIYI